MTNVLNRRQFIITGALATLATTVAPSLKAASEDAAATRKKAAGRNRRVIFNNDGDDVSSTDAPATKEGFLSVRMDHIVGCGVDTVFYCTSMSSVFSHTSKVLEMYTTLARNQHNRMPALLAMGTDPLRLAVEFCRKQAIEVFWTLRMNDIHDNYFPDLRAKWKVQHPEQVMGTPEEASHYDRRDPRSIWTLADYERGEVRDRMIRAVGEVLDHYDLDGIDLDFLRHVCFFKETRLGQPVTPAHRDLLTDMVGQIRRLVLAASERKGKPILLSARVLQTMALNRQFGLDLEQWIQRGYLDLVTVGAGFDPFTSPAKSLVDWCHGRDLPAYGSITAEGLSTGLWSGPPIPHSDLSEKNEESWLGAAANVRASGADGVMTFNLFAERQGIELSRSVLRSIGDADRLDAADKLFCIEHLHDDDYAFMFRSVLRDGRLPAPVRKETTVSRVLPVADDIPGRAGRIRKLQLRVYLDYMRAPDKVTLRLNGAKLATTSDHPQWLSADVLPQLVRKGANDVAVTFEGGASASWDLTERSVELRVHYDRPGVPA